MKRKRSLISGFTKLYIIYLVIFTDKCLKNEKREANNFCLFIYKTRN